MAVWGFVAGIVTILLATFFTDPPDPAKLKGLIYEKGKLQEEEVGQPWYSHPAFFAAVVGLMFVCLNWIFF